MSDLTVPPELIDLHPVLARMVKLTGATVVSAQACDAWACQPGSAVLVFTRKSDHFSETLDLAAVLPELQATAGGNLRIGLLPPTASDTVARRHGYRQCPTLVLWRDGQILGAVEGPRDWEAYTLALLRALAAKSGGKPVAGSPPTA